MDDATQHPSPSAEPERDDYVFRFRLQEGETSREGYDDPLLEVVRGLLEDLSRTIVFTCQGRRVRVDGFRLLQEPEQQYEIFPGEKARPVSGRVRVAGAEATIGSNGATDEHAHHGGSRERVG